MNIQTRIRFEAGGVTITQSFDEEKPPLALKEGIERGVELQGSFAPPAEPNSPSAVARALPPIQTKGGGELGRTGPDGGGEHFPTSPDGGGEPGRTGPDGGGEGSPIPGGLTIVFGSLIMDPGRSGSGRAYSLLSGVPETKPAAPPPSGKT